MLTLCLGLLIEYVVGYTTMLIVHCRRQAEINHELNKLVTILKMAEYERRLYK
jgi:hypothetical protein